MSMPFYTQPQFFDPAKEQEAKRRRLFAEQMMQQGSQPMPTEYAGGLAVPQSPLLGLSKAIQSGIGGYQMRKADEADAEIQRQRQEIYQQALNAPTREEAGAILAQDPSMMGEALKMKFPAAAVGGATGQIADRLIAEGVDPLEAIFIAKSGLGVGRTYDARTGTVSPMMGAPEAGGDIKYGEEAGKQRAVLEYKPRIDTAQALAKDVATAKTSVGGYGQDVANSIQLIDNLIASKGFNNAIGPVQSRLPTVRGSTADAEAMLNQIKGVAFLDSIQEMRGLGALSNAEGDAATRAATRMQSATSEQGFREAAEDYKAIMSQGLARMQAKAGVPQQMPQPAIPNRADPLAAARDAISRGAPREAVIKRLQENGIDATGL